jgi:hypothetical protein
MRALRQEHGHEQEGTWESLHACGHMHGQHAITDSTQGQHCKKIGASLGRPFKQWTGHEVAWFWDVGASIGG